MKKMKKKILGLFIIILLLFTYYAFTVEVVGLTYTRSGGSNINDVARIIDDSIYLDGDYNTYSVKVPYSKIDIYEYNSNVHKNISGTWTERTLYQETGRLYYRCAGGSGTQYLQATAVIGEGTQKLENVITIVYRDALKKNGINYDVKINVKEINKTGPNQASICSWK